MRKTLLFALSCAVVVFGSLAAVHATSPCFIDRTLFATGYFVEKIASGEYLLLRQLHFGWIYLGPLFLLLLAIRHWFRDRRVTNTALLQ